MRRAALVVVITLLVAGLGASVVDWRFWQRWYTIPDDAGEWPASYYQPTVQIVGDSRGFFPVVKAGDETISTNALEAAATWAEAHNSAALLVLHRGTIQLERYWQGIADDSLFSGRAMTRSLLAVLVGIALEEGDIQSLDDPIEQYLPVWRGDRRGKITLRQLLWNVSGLENPPLAGDPDPFAKNARLSLGSDFNAAAASFEMEHEPGEFFALSNANAQLLGAALEAATGTAYETYFQQKLWGPIAASEAELYMDRPGGTPAVYCCFRATPRDWMRLGVALLNDGQVGANQLWPKGWIAEMTHGSAANPNYGYQVWVGNPPGQFRAYIQGSDFGVPHGDPIAAERVYFLEGGGGRTLWLLPDQDLVILRLGYFSPEWQTSSLPNLILSGLHAPNQNVLEQP
jgi:CubicO group peptidase (beta-lactamase class C family)